MKTFKEYMVEKSLTTKRRKELDKLGALITGDVNLAKTFQKDHRYGKQKDARQWFIKVTGDKMNASDGDYLHLNLLKNLPMPD